MRLRHINKCISICLSLIIIIIPYLNWYKIRCAYFWIIFLDLNKSVVRKWVILTQSDLWTLTSFGNTVWAKSTRPLYLWQHLTINSNDVGGPHLSSLYIDYWRTLTINSNDVGPPLSLLYIDYWQTLTINSDDSWSRDCNVAMSHALSGLRVLLL